MKNKIGQIGRMGLMAMAVWLMAGCSRGSDARDAKIAGAPSPATANGRWGWTNDAGGRLMFYLHEEDGTITGAMDVAGTVRGGPYRVYGFRNGKRISLYYLVPHCLPEIAMTNEHALEFQGELSDSNISGVLLITEGIRHEMTSMVLAKLDGEATIPALDEKPIVDPPLPSDPDQIKIEQDLKSLAQSTAAVSNSWKELTNALAEEPPKRTVPSAVYNKITADAQTRHPNDYATQEYVIKEQVQAYLRLHP